MPLRAALTLLHRHRGDPAIALIAKARLETIELQIDEPARDLRLGVEAQRIGAVKLVGPLSRSEVRKSWF